MTTTEALDAPPRWWNADIAIANYVIETLEDLLANGSCEQDMLGIHVTILQLELYVSEPFDGDEAIVNAGRDAMRRVGQLMPTLWT